MGQAVREFSNDFIRKSSLTLSTKNAWAQWARRRWPNNGLKGAMADFGLSEGEARGLIYATVSQSTIDKLLEHRFGGFALGLEILAIKTGITLEQHIEHQAREAANARSEWEARERHIARLRSSLCAVPDHPNALDS